MPLSLPDSQTRHFRKVADKESPRRRKLGWEDLSITYTAQVIPWEQGGTIFNKGENSHSTLLLATAIFAAVAAPASVAIAAAAAVVVVAIAVLFCRLLCLLF